MEALDTTVIRQALDWWRNGRSPALVTVARTWGSSPRPPGSLMAITQDGEVTGSVSGGCIEDDLIDRVRREGLAAVCANSVPAVLRYGIHAEEAHRFGLPCGGTIELVMEPVKEGSLLQDWLQALERRQSGVRRLDLKTGLATLDPGGLDGAPVLVDGRWTLPFGPQARLIVIGAGDLSRYFCELANGLGFSAVVCDPRVEGEMNWGMPGVSFTREMPDDLILRLKPDRRTAVVALTHDPKLDDLAIMDALQSDAFYVGAIGSRRNSEQRRDRLRTHFGLDDEALNRLHGPAGLYIGSKTPAEIALSIMAEVVATLRGVALHPQAQVERAKASRVPAAVLGDTATICNASR